MGPSPGTEILSSAVHPSVVPTFPLLTKNVSLWSKWRCRGGDCGCFLPILLSVFDFGEAYVARIRTLGGCQYGRRWRKNWLEQTRTTDVAFRADGGSRNSSIKESEKRRCGPETVFALLSSSILTDAMAISQYNCVFEAFESSMGIL